MIMQPGYHTLLGFYFLRWTFDFEYKSAGIWKLTTISGTCDIYFSTIDFKQPSYAMVFLACKTRRISTRPDASFLSPRTSSLSPVYLSFPKMDLAARHTVTRRWISSQAIFKSTRSQKMNFKALDRRHIYIYIHSPPPDAVFALAHHTFKSWWAAQPILPVLWTILLSRYTGRSHLHLTRIH